MPTTAAAIRKPRTSTFPFNYNMCVIVFVCFFLIISQLRSNKQNGHFTQIARDQSYKVGCSISQYVEQRGGTTWYTVYYVCNYAVTNISNYPIYEKGAPASKCKTGPNAKYPGLCSVNEKYEGSPFIKY